ncbi:MAG: NADH:flavin oxidoreductase/NADH oxidase [Hyphomicrobiales bacterium]|nr:NADH:flavin oxidoreductase/NADH oxidase [Alphaproteobacteria bacterium]
MADSKLFSPITLRGLTLDNRIVLSPMCQYAAKDGNASDWHIAHLGTYALANLGLAITEATAVEPKGRISPWCLGLYSDAHQESLGRILRFYRDYGTTKFGIQLAHAGRKSSVLPSFMIRKAVPVSEGGWIPMSSSDYRDDVHTPPQVMTLDDIEAAKIAWRDATRRASDIGVDLIELHFAHGYLVNQFLSPLINTRQDQYGGSRENRMRLALEIFDLCRAAFAADRPIGVRISATDWVEGGWGIEDSVVLATELRARGCDYICTSSGGVSLKQKIDPRPLYQIPLADAVRRGSGITTMAVGQITEPPQAEAILAEGQADIIAIGRRLMFDPHWAWRAASEQGVFLKYPARYRNANPRIGHAMDFPESPEKRKRMMDVMREEERVQAQGTVAR